MSSELKQQFTADMKTAMKAKEKQKLGTIRLVLAAIKQIEVDERIELDDTRILAILDKMVKQRRDSLEQFQTAGRDDLVQQEQFELDLLQTYLPTALSEDDINKLIAEAVASTGASSMKDMGKLMAVLKPKLQGRADMGLVSKIVKQSLT